MFTAQDAFVVKVKIKTVIFIAISHPNKPLLSSTYRNIVNLCHAANIIWKREVYIRNQASKI